MISPFGLVPMYMVPSLAVTILFMTQESSRRPSMSTVCDCRASFMVPVESITVFSVSPFRKSAAVFWRVVMLFTACAEIVRVKIAIIAKNAGLEAVLLVMAHPLKVFYIFFRAVQRFSLYADYTERL